MKHKELGRFTGALSLMWLGGYGLLWALHESGLMDSLPGRLNYSFTFLLLGGMVLFSAINAAKARPSLKEGAIVGVPGILLLVLASGWAPLELAPAFGVGLIMLLTGTWITASLGREVVSATYIWPLILVVTAFDLWSVLSSHGVTQKMVVAFEAGPALLNVMVLTVPIPAIGLKPVLGIGDALFLGFIAGAVDYLQLEWRRFILGVALGFGTCLLALLALEVPVPALVFIAPWVGICLGRSVATTPKEVLAAGVFASSLLGVQFLLENQAHW